MIQRVKKGDTEAFSLLVEKYHKRLLGFIFRLIGKKEEVEDLGQEVFLSAFKSLSKFDEDRGTPFSAWLFTLARNQCISHWRKQVKYRQVELDGKTLKHRGPGPLDVLLGKEEREALETCLGQVPEPYRSTLLSSLEGHSIREIAEQTGLARTTVKTRLFRAREKVKDLARNMWKGSDHGGV